MGSWVRPVSCDIKLFEESGEGGGAKAIRDTHAAPRIPTWCAQLQSSGEKSCESRSPIAPLVCAIPSFVRLLTADLS